MTEDEYDQPIGEYPEIEPEVSLQLQIINIVRRTIDGLIDLYPK